MEYLHKFMDVISKPGEVSKERYPLEYIHSRCGCAAFYLDSAVPGGRVFGSCVYPDGTHPSPGELIMCGSCGEPLMSSLKLEHVRKRA